MEIKKLTINDKNFFKDMGKLITSQLTVRELGEPVITNESQIWYVVYDKKRVVGFSSNYVKKDGMHIGYLYVTPRYRNDGLGSQLLRKQIEYAKEIKVDSLKVVAPALIVKLYEKHGFNITYEFVNYKKMELILNED